MPITHEAFAKRHFARYRDEHPVILRLRFTDLVEANPTHAPLFSRFNSGAPRCSGGRRSPRSSGTFVHGEAAEFRPGQVIELTFADAIALPAEVMVARDPAGPWAGLEELAQHDRLVRR